MNDHYEAIRSKTVCPECSGADMGIVYMWENSGMVKKKGTVLGMDSYSGVGNALMITCRACGFVAKTFLIAR